MSEVFVGEYEIDHKHSYGFCRMVKEFYDKTEEFHMDIHSMGYNDMSGNYWIYLENGISFYWNKLSAQSGFITTNSDNGEEHYHDTYDDAASDISY
jgi:hypothetical protein